MIVSIFLQIIYSILWVITSPLRALDDVVLSSGFSGSISTAGHYISGFNNIIPLDTVLVLLGLYVGIELAYMGYKLIMWLIKRFPTQS